MRKPIYLDYNATTPLAAEVIRAMRPYEEEIFGNPSSSHYYGLEARAAVEGARRQVAQGLNARPDEIVFTSGGTEANNYAIKGAAWAHREHGRHVITSVIEHPAVLEVCACLEENGFRITRVPVDNHGRVCPDDVKRAVRKDTILISIMHANNEVGTIQPIREIAALARAKGILTHTDAAQTVGKITVNVQNLGVDLLSIAGHKLYAPKGVGALYIRRGVTLQKFMHGAGHEQGRRAGTENVIGVVGLGAACAIAHQDLKKNTSVLQTLTTALWTGLAKGITDLRLNGHPRERLPNTLNISFRGVEAHKLLDDLKDHIAASAGAACHSGMGGVSSVLQAMKVPLEWAMGAVRFSTGRFTTEKDIRQAVILITRAVERWNK